MHTDKLEKKYQFIFWGMIFLFLGITSSPTMVSGYHILVFIPTLFLFKQGMKYKLPKSSWALIGLIIWGLIATLYNNSDLIKPFKAYQELKYYMFGVFCIGTLTYFFSRAPQKHIKLILNLLLFAIVVGFFVGISRSKFGFDPVKWSYVGDKYHTRVGGFTNYMRYGYSSALMLVLGLGACFNFDKVKEIVSKRWLTIFLSFNLLAVIFSETRGALLALIAGSSFLLIKYIPKLGKTLVALGIVGVIAIGIYSSTQESTNRYLNINDGSNKVRLSQFYTAVTSMKEKPFFGLGADQFPYNVIEIKKRNGIWADDYSGHAHNILLEHGANYGIPGLIAFMCFLGFWFFEMIQKKSDFGWVIASYIVAFTVGGQVELLFDVINSHLVFFLYSFSQIDVKVLASK
jgi:O-antigen ligase